MGLLGFGGIGMILFWVILLAVVVLIVRGLTGSSNAGISAPPPHAQTPLEILQTRYAKGEITKEEYEEAKHAL